MNAYIIFLITFTVVASFIDFYTNKFYAKVWHKKSLKERSLLVFYLLFHNALYYCIYFTILFTIYYYKTIKLQHLVGYLTLLVIVPLHWKTNDDKCWFTVQQNRLLEIDDMHGFRDPCLILTNRHSVTAGTGGLRDKLYYIYFICSIIVTVAMIFMKIRK
jgi:hypothetical protein